MITTIYLLSPALALYSCHPSTAPMPRLLDGYERLLSDSHQKHKSIQVNTGYQYLQSVVSNHDAIFLVDTGAQFVYIDSSVASKLQHRDDLSKTFFPYSTILGRSLTSTYIIDCKDALSRCSSYVKADGILGMDFLVESKAILDWHKACIYTPLGDRTNKSFTFPSSKTRRIYPMVTKEKSSLPYLLLTVGGVEGYFLLDSGSQSNYIFRQYCDKLAVTAGSKRGTTTGVGSTVNIYDEFRFLCNFPDNYHVTLPFVIADSMPNLDQHVHMDSKCIGILGNQFMNNCAVVYDTVGMIISITTSDDLGVDLLTGKWRMTSTQTFKTGRRKTTEKCTLHFKNNHLLYQFGQNEHLYTVTTYHAKPGWLDLYNETLHITLPCLYEQDDKSLKIAMPNASTSKLYNRPNSFHLDHTSDATVLYFER